MRLLRAWRWLPLAFAAVYAVLLLTELRSITRSIYLNADVVSAPFIGELYPAAPHGAEVLLGNFPWYSALWFEQLTRGLPFHRELWQAAPWALSLVGVALVSWSVAKVAGRWAAAIAAVVLACAGPPLLQLQFSWTFHAVTWVHVALLGAFLVACAARGGLLGPPPLHVAACVALAAISAVGLASDRLLLVAGVAPFVLAGVAVAFMVERRARAWMAMSAVLVGVTAVIGAAVIQQLMDEAGVRSASFEVTLAGMGSLATNLRILLESVALIFNGDFGGQKPDLSGLLALACAALALGAVVAVVRSGAGLLRAGLNRPGAAAPTPRAVARSAHLLFWMLVATGLAVAFVLSSVPTDKFSARYIVGAAMAVVALAPLAALAAGRRAQVALVAGACVIVVGSISGLLRHDLQNNPSRYPDGYTASELLKLTRQEGLRYGYAGYWDAAPLSWQSQGRLEVYPVWECPDRPRQTCPFYLHRISSWYRPRPQIRSFLVIDPAQPRSAPPLPGRSFGRPERVAHAAQLTVYIYGYDIASRFAR